jgi:dipeptidyl aminopeptidase/acylaminoacyl peptidase
MSIMIKTKSLRVIFAVAVCLLLNVVSLAQSYQKPPKEIMDVLNAPVTPTVILSPTRDYMVLMEGVRYPPISDLAQPMLRLAGLRINPKTNGPHNAPYFVGLTVKKISDGKETKVVLPANARVSFPSFSADGKQFAFYNITPNGLELWVAETATAKAKQIKGVQLNGVLGGAFQWLADQKTLLARLVPAKRSVAPSTDSVPTGPNIQETSGRAGAIPTFQDLLKSSQDELLFDYYVTAQLAVVDVSSGKITNMGQPAIFSAVDAAPDGQHILVGRIKKPYSYVFPLNRFPREVEIWDRSAKVVHKVADLPLTDQIPNGGVPTGPRSYEWRPTEPATLVWVEAQDDGDPRKKVAFRDRVLMLKAPFAGQPTELVKTVERYTNTTWLEKDGVVFVTEVNRDTLKRKTLILNADNPSQEQRAIWELSVNDRYNNPGAPVLRRLPNGQQVVLQKGDWIYLQGPGASPEGDRPFLDRFNLKTLKSERIFRCDTESYENFVALLDDEAKSFITRRETPTEPPNYLMRSVSQSAEGNGAASSISALTSFKDPTPQLRGIKKQLVKYKRADGVDLSFTLYLPPNYKEGTRLPTVVWAYPLEFTDPFTAGQVSGSTKRFTTLGGYSHLFFLLQGYAVLDDATMPVVGDPQTVNNTFIEQIVSSAKAAIDKAVEMGVTDPERVGVGGHSYGAFMTANLLAHSDLFRAGIARSGAYNRTLTPFGFQSERRNFWEAPEMYVKVSPFMYADKLKEPILLIHGEADNNQGTFPIQSERLFAALRGNGGTARLVMLPHESHGYAARESTEHVLYEMITWFDKYVKNARSRERRAQTEKQ